MADIDSLANGLRAAELGCDWVGTTLFGYTEATAGHKPPAWDLLPPLRSALPAAVPLRATDFFGLKPVAGVDSLIAASRCLDHAKERGALHGLAEAMGRGRRAPRQVQASPFFANSASSLSS